MKTAKQLLTEARDLLVQKGWTQEAYARDAANKPVFGEDDRAVCYCSIGALRAARGPGWTNSDEMLKARKALVQTIRPDLGGEMDAFDIITNWNDGRKRTKEEVLDAFDRAIAQADG